MTARLVVLASGTGSLLAALIAACADPSYGARVVAVASDRPDIEALSRADAAAIPNFSLLTKDFSDRDAWDAALTDRVVGFEPDLVISAGFMKLVGKRFLDAFPNAYINTHPALLPSFPGMHGARDAIDYGVKVSGATLFVVDGGMDTGPIIDQRAVEVLDGDTEASLHERIKGVERAMLVDSVGRMARDGWAVSGRKVTIG